MGTNVTLPPDQLDKLVEALDVQIATANRGGIHALGATEDFCKAWPIAKPILDILGKIPALGLIVGIIEAIGNAYAKKHCGTS
jgi:hypothetical protein